MNHKNINGAALAIFMMCSALGFVVVSAMIFHLMTGELVIKLEQTNCH